MIGRASESNAQNSSAQANLWQKAADEGDAKAQLSLGNAYHFGVGVEQDDKKAALWLLKAADQGNANAQYEIGNAYFFCPFCIG